MSEFFKEYVDMWKRWSDFSGKSTVRDFWMAWLVSFILGIVISIILLIAPSLNFVYYIYSLAIIVPSWAVMIRRFHDVGKSGWYWLWILLPLIGWVIVILALIKPSA